MGLFGEAIKRYGTCLLTLQVVSTVAPGLSDGALSEVSFGGAPSEFVCMSKQPR